VIAAAGELVAGTCSHTGQPLTFGFQGMGEPFADPHLLEQADKALRAVAFRHHLPVFSFITSNATMPAEAYRWAATRFDRICLSMDGPPQWHNRTRRDRSGNETSAKVLETVRLLKSLGKTPACRVTVTSENVSAMAEMATFLYVELGLIEVQFEPVFFHPQLSPTPEAFVHGLLRAGKIARIHNGKADYSGYRPYEEHGPYCQTLRQVLFVTRNGTASACLFHEGEPRDSPFTVGGVQDQEFIIHQEQIDIFNQRLTNLPEACADCAIRNHCTRGCPDFCPVGSGVQGQDIKNSLGCRINLLLHDVQSRTQLPEILIPAEQELKQSMDVASNIDAHLTLWQGFLDQVRERLPSARIDDGGASIYLGQLSPGCVHCKHGSWDCIFVTHRCNLACSFCYSSKVANQKPLSSALGETVEHMVSNYLSLNIRGISVTGGEPFLEPENTLSLLTNLRRQLPDRYLWLYTNGVLLRQEHIDRLETLGLNEIRFNTAATGYRDPIVLRTIAQAAKQIPTVTVEIPAIPGHTNTVLGCLTHWIASGVKHLNLHELMREDQSLSARLEGDFGEIVLPDGHVTGLSTASRYTALEIMEAVVNRRLPVDVNFCSLTNKLLQLRGRRRNLAKLHPNDLVRVDSNSRSR
jgi:radical SAM protein with 4Fe4S-binding SPASM domain